MEGVPRLSMMNIELKICDDEETNFNKLKAFIHLNYGEPPEKYTKEFDEINQLRRNAINVHYDFTGCNLLKKYFAQLLFLQHRFPMTEGDECAITFVWEDKFSPSVKTKKDICFEQANILYNIGALHSSLGAMESRVTSEGMKVACTHFQCAAWAFSHLDEQYENSFSDDFNSDLLSLKVTILLAQAQECILEKSMLDSRKSSLIAKIAQQIVDYYAAALKYLENDKVEDLVNYHHESSKAFKKKFELKRLYYQSVVYLFRGNQALEAQHYGESVAFLKKATDCITESEKHLQSKNDESREAISFTKDVIFGKYTAAKKDNDFIYHELIPQLESLPATISTSLVKGVPFDPSDDAVSGGEIFAKLIPMEAHESSSLYSEKKAELLRRIAGEIDMRNEELAKFNSSINLSKDNIKPTSVRLPTDLLEACAAVSVRPDVTAAMVKSMKELSSIALDIQYTLEDLENMIGDEYAKDREFESRYGKRMINAVFEQAKNDLLPLQKQLAKANDSTDELQKAMAHHCDNLKVLGLPLDELQAQLPTVHAVKTEDDENLSSELIRLLNKVDEMKGQRDTLETQLRQDIQADDITSKIVNADGDCDALFDEELKKHDKLVGILRQNLNAQQNVFQAITEANAKYADLKVANRKANADRDHRIADLVSSWLSRDELTSKSTEGIECFKQIQLMVDKLKARLTSLVKTHDDERTRFEARIKPKELPKRPSAPKPPGQDGIIPSDMTLPPMSFAKSNDGAPKLKDYLPFMKPKRFGHLKTNDSFLPANQTGGAFPSSSSGSSTQAPPPVAPPQSVGNPLSYNPQMNQPPANQPVNFGGAHFQQPPTHAVHQQPLPPQLQMPQPLPPQHQMPSSTHQNSHQGPFTTAQTPFSAPSIDRTKTSGVLHQIPNSSHILPSNQPYDPNRPGIQADSPQFQGPGGGCVHPSTTGTGSVNSFQHQQYYPQPVFPTGQTLNTVQPNPVQQHIPVQQPPAVVPTNSTVSAPYHQQQSQQNVAYSHLPQTQNNVVSSQHPYNDSQYQNYVMPAQAQQQGGQQLPYTPQGFIPQTSTTASFTPAGATPAPSAQQPYSSQQVYNGSQTFITTASPPQITSSSLTQPYNSQQSTFGAQQHSGQQSNFQPTNQPLNFQPAGQQPNFSAQSNLPITTTTNTQVLNGYQQQLPFSQQAYPGPTSGSGSAERPETIPAAPQPSITSIQQQQFTTQNLTGPHTYQTSNATGVQPHLTPTSQPQYNQPVYGQTMPQTEHHPGTNFLQYRNGSTPPRGDQLEDSWTAANQFLPAPMKPTGDLPKSADRMLSTSPTSSEKSHVLTPRIAKSESPKVPPKKIEEKEQTVSTSLVPAIDEKGHPRNLMDDDEFLENFAQEVEKYQRFVADLTKPTLSGPPHLETITSELSQQLDRESRKLSCAVAKCSTLMNRYCDSIPYDFNRVKLKMSKEDYVNASLIRSAPIHEYLRLNVAKPPNLIITQHPLRKTIAEFWCCVFEQGCEMIITIVNSQEQVKADCAYFPEKRGQPLTVNSLTVTLQSSSQSGSIIKRIFNIYHAGNNATRSVIQLQLLSFPTCDAPNDPQDFIALLSETLVLFNQQRSSSKPIIVECIDGGAKSSLFVALLLAILNVNLGNGLVDIRRLLVELNQQRKFTFTQDFVKFFYRTLLHHAIESLKKRGVLVKRASFDDSHKDKREVAKSPIDAPTVQKLFSHKVITGSLSPPRSQSHSKNPSNGSDVDHPPHLAAISAPSQSLPVSPLHTPTIGTLPTAGGGDPPPMSQTLQDLQNPDKFHLDDKGPEKITKQDFLTGESALGKAKVDPDDPLGSLDPLWVMK